MKSCALLERKMKTDTEIKVEGMNALAQALGDVDAEKFVALLQREPGDYTKWQRTLWPERSVEDISRAAMTFRGNQR
jgi:hypothetical protein